MSKLKELEKRLRDEPDNLGLRVVVAGALHEAGRREDAIELYRSVAIAYREQGRPQQAITVCRSILELAPDDAACKDLLGALTAGQGHGHAQAPGTPEVRPSPPRLRPPTPPVVSAPVPRPSPPPSVGRPSPLPGERASPPRLRPPSEPEERRRSSYDETPLPPPMPYHLADPSHQQLSRADLPPSLQAELDGLSEIAGIAAAARQISASLIAASRQDDDDVALPLETRRFPRGDEHRPAWPPPTAPVELVVGEAEEAGDDDPTLPPRERDRANVGDDDVTLPPRAGPGERIVERAGDDERTEPRELPTRAKPPSIAPPTVATGPLAGAFFASVPPHNRTAVLQRFRRRLAGVGLTVIRRGEIGHGLVIVVRGQLEVRDDATGAVLFTIDPGDYIGEASLLARAPAAAHVVAATESEILVLAADDFYEVAAAFPALSAELRARAR